MEPQEGMYFPDYIKEYVERERRKINNPLRSLRPQDYTKCLDLLARAGVVIDFFSEELNHLFRQKYELENKTLSQEDDMQKREKLKQELEWRV